ncbi:MAG: HAMP domain-containing histidine kinase [Rhizobiaceae bacterium]|nr:HAMP domain-containing histidine kinase [Rhizobiaceae bacterium]
MRRLFPRALPAWILIIVVGGLLATQIAMFSITATNVSESNEIVDLYRLNERALSLVRLLQRTEKHNREEIIASLVNSTFAVKIGSAPAIVSTIPPDDVLAELEDIMVARLARYGVVDARVRRDSASSIQTDGTPQPSSDAGTVETDLIALARDFLESDRYTVSLQFKDGQWINFTTPITPAAAMFTPQSVPVYIGIAACVALLSFWAVRRLTAPYLLLEDAVTRLGKDFKTPPVSEQGSPEYRSAARALNSMQKRLLEYVEDREHLAAALAHDLRTPVTKMRLRLELLRNPAVKAALKHDIENIELTVKSVMDFAKLRVSEEEPERIDFWSMVYAVADEYPDAELEDDQDEGERLLCTVQPASLRRCIVNLVENAILYGGKAHISVRATERDLRLLISDEGPGIPENQLEAVFRPFHRLERSRSRETGGSGLGLTIARSLIQKMGGDIALANTAGGGLCATLILPRADPA